jgi:hypothetical protein
MRSGLALVLDELALHVRDLDGQLRARVLDGCRSVLEHSATKDRSRLAAGPARQRATHGALYKVPSPVLTSQMCWGKWGRPRETVSDDEVSQYVDSHPRVGRHQMCVPPHGFTTTRCQEVGSGGDAANTARPRPATSEAGADEVGKNESSLVVAGRILVAYAASCSLHSATTAHLTCKTHFASWSTYLGVASGGGRPRGPRVPARACSKTGGRPRHALWGWGVSPAGACPADHGTRSRSQILIEARSMVPRNV